MSGKGMGILRALFLLDAVLMIGGGVVGYVRKGSRKSLLAGGLCGALVLASAGALAGPNGLVLGTAAAAAVAAAMLKRYLAARSAVPGALATYNAFLAVGALHGALRV